MNYYLSPPPNDTVKGKHKNGSTLSLILSISKLQINDEYFFIVTFDNVTYFHDNIIHVKESQYKVLDAILSSIVVAEDLTILFVNK